MWSRASSWLWGPCTSRSSDFRKFLAGAFFVNSDVLFYLRALIGNGSGILHTSDQALGNRIDRVRKAGLDIQPSVRGFPHDAASAPCTKSFHAVASSGASTTKVAPLIVRSIRKWAFMA